MLIKLTGCELISGVWIGCRVVVVLELDPDVDALAERVMPAALRLTRTDDSPPAALATDIETEALGDSGENKCSGVKLPSESSLGREEGGVSGIP